MMNANNTTCLLNDNEKYESPPPQYEGENKKECCFSNNKSGNQNQENSGFRSKTYFLVSIFLIIAFMIYHITFTVISGINLSDDSELQRFFSDSGLESPNLALIRNSDLYTFVLGILSTVTFITGLLSVSFNNRCSFFVFLFCLLFLTTIDTASQIYMCFRGLGCPSWIDMVINIISFTGFSYYSRFIGKNNSPQANCIESNSSYSSYYPTSSSMIMTTDNNNNNNTKLNHGVIYSGL